LEVPLYTIQIDQFGGTIEFDPINKQITQMQDIQLKVDNIDTFVTDFFGHDFSFVADIEITNFFSFAAGKRVYEANTTYSDIIKRVVVEYDDEGHIYSFHYYAESNTYPGVDHFSILLIFGLYSLAFIIILALIVTIHFIVKRVKGQIEAVIAPLL